MPRRWPKQQYLEWAVAAQTAYDSGAQRSGRRQSRMLFDILTLKLEDDERSANEDGGGDTERPEG